MHKIIGVLKRARHDPLNSGCVRDPHQEQKWKRGLNRAMLPLLKRDLAPSDSGSNSPLLVVEYLLILRLLTG